MFYNWKTSDESNHKVLVLHCTPVCYQFHITTANNFQNTLSNLLGNTHFSLMTSGCQGVADQSLAQHGWGFSNQFHKQQNTHFYQIDVWQGAPIGLQACVRGTLNPLGL